MTTDKSIPKATAKRLSFYYRIFKRFNTDNIEKASSKQIADAMGIDSVWAFDVDFGAGYNFRISDRFIVAAEGYGGVWTKPASKSSVSKDKKISGASGIAFGGRLSGNYYISSALKAYFFLQDIKIIITNRLHL